MNSKQAQRPKWSVLPFFNKEYSLCLLLYIVNIQNVTTHIPSPALSLHPAIGPWRISQEQILMISSYY